jgi:peptidoglycan/xylan/chitin deacetylase (PgdA/CDA1 family)
VRRKGNERWRWQVKSALATAIAGSCGHRLAHLLALRPQRPLVLGYHRVVDDFASAARTEMPSMLTSRDMFERHIDWLGKHFRFATLDEIGEHMANNVPFSEPVCAITFDDGYLDVYEHAYPILKRKGIPWAMFVVTDLVDRPSWHRHDKLYRAVARGFDTWSDPRRELFGVLADVGVEAGEILRDRSATRTPTMVMTTLLPRLSRTDVGRVIDGLEAGLANGLASGGTVPPILGWEEIADLQRNGVTIGSHTETHVSLPMESPETVAKELEASKRTLEQHLGEPVTHLAYPGGQFTTPVLEAARRAGYRFGYTACPHSEPEYRALTIERLLLWEGSSADADGKFSSGIFSCQADGIWLPARKCERVHYA